MVRNILLVTLLEYTTGMAAFDGLVIGATWWGVSNSTADNDNCSNGASGCSGNNKGKKGKDFRGGKKKDPDQWGPYSGNKYKDFRKWWEREKQKDGSLGDLETKKDRDEAYEDYQADQEKQDEDKTERKEDKQQ